MQLYRRLAFPPLASGEIGAERCDVLTVLGRGVEDALTIQYHVMHAGTVIRSGIFDMIRKQARIETIRIEARAGILHRRLESLTIL